MDNTKTITAERDISRIPCNFHFCTTRHFFTCSQIFFILPLLIIWTSEFLHPPQAAEEINLEAQIKANWTSRERERGRTRDSSQPTSLVKALTKYQNTLFELEQGFRFTVLETVQTKIAKTKVKMI